MSKYVLKITFTSDWHIGTGSGIPGGIDRLVYRDQDGLPAIPAKSIIGVWRDAAERLARALDNDAADGPWQQEVETIFGDQPSQSDAVQIAIPKRALLQVTQARYPKDLRDLLRRQQDQLYLLTKVRPGVAIDEETGRAKSKHLRFIEVALGATQLVATVEVPDTLPKTSLLLLFAATKLIERIGGKRRRGLGKCEWEIDGVNIANSIKELKSHQQPMTTPIVLPEMIESKTNHEAGWDLYQVELTLQSPVAISDAKLGNVGTTLEYIPGTALLPEFAKLVLGSQFRQAIPKGLFRVRNAYLQVNNDRGRPVPLALFNVKNSGAPTDPHNLINRFLQEQPKSPQYKQIRTGYYSNSKDAAWPFYGRIELVNRIHNTVDDESQRPNEDVGGLFTYQAISTRDEHGQPVKLVCELHISRSLSLPDVSKKLTELSSIRVGRSRKDDYGAVTIRCQKVQNSVKHQKGIKAGETLFVWLISDVLLMNERLRPEPTAERLRLTLSKRLQVELISSSTSSTAASTLSRIRRIESWNRNWSLPRPTLATLQAGSCFAFVAKGDISAIQLSEIELDGIGERRAEGYGEICFNDPLVAESPQGVESTVGHSIRTGSDRISSSSTLFTFARTLEASFTKELIRRYALLFANTSKNLDQLLGWTIIKSNQQPTSIPTMSQLGTLRSAVVKLSKFNVTNSVTDWLKQLSESKHRTKSWPEIAKSSLRNLVTSSDKIWELIAIPPAEWPSLTTNSQKDLKSELWSFAVRALLFASMHAQKRRLEKEST